MKNILLAHGAASTTSTVACLGSRCSSHFRALQKRRELVPSFRFSKVLDAVIKSSAICYKVLLEALGLDGGLEVGVE